MTGKSSEERIMHKSQVWRKLLEQLPSNKPYTEDTILSDKSRASDLEDTLKLFKATAHVVQTIHGPAFTRFELELGGGTNTDEIIKLEKDIAYRLSVASVRFVVPNPGDRLIHIEAPNGKTTTVAFRDVMECIQMQNSKSPLSIALGKDVAGESIICDLIRKQNMLILGQTGSGKTTCINSIITSILFRSDPDAIKLILIDPKVVELHRYNGISHLLIPVVNNSCKAVAALSWAVKEMQRRCVEFQKAKVHDFDEYNDLIQSADDKKTLRRIVIVIDEVADLLIYNKRDVEYYIRRITQLACATGIHLIIATQWTRDDVISYLETCYFPIKLIFKSNISQSTGYGNPDHLLGWGDMLYISERGICPTRVQGCYLMDEEIDRIVKCLREMDPCSYDNETMEEIEKLSKEFSKEQVNKSEAGNDTPNNASDMKALDELVKHIEELIEQKEREAGFRKDQE